VWDPVRQKVVLFGGVSNTTLTIYDQVYEYDGTTWTLRTGLGAGPSARWGAGLAYDSRRSVLVMSCGSPEGATCDTWELGTSWTQVTTTATPTSRHRLAMAFDAVRGRTILANGASGPNSQLLFPADSLDYDGANWSTLPSNPPGRGWVAMAYDSTRGKMVLFGGFANNADFGDTWEY
jgi:hypothetical protein